MAKIIEYVVCTANNLSSLESNINDNIEKGYSPFGNMVISYNLETSIYNQPMVKYERKEIISTSSLE